MGWPIQPKANPRFSHQYMTFIFHNEKLEYFNTLILNQNYKAFSPNIDNDVEQLLSLGPLSLVRVMNQVGLILALGQRLCPPCQYWLRPLKKV